MSYSIVSVYDVYRVGGKPVSEANTLLIVGSTTYPSQPFNRFADKPIRDIAESSTIRSFFAQDGFTIQKSNNRRPQAAREPSNRQ